MNNKDNFDYYDFVIENLNKTIEYAEYVSGTLIPDLKSKKQIQKEHRIKKLQKINNINNGIE